MNVDALGELRNYAFQEATLTMSMSLEDPSLLKAQDIMKSWYMRLTQQHILVYRITYRLCYFKYSLSDRDLFRLFFASIQLSRLVLGDVLSSLNDIDNV